jgi:DNA-binding NarL/FixJ family response regulator
MSPITVVIADRLESRRAAYRRLLEPEGRVEVVAESRSSLETVATVGRLRPRILLLDLRLSEGEGVALLPVLRRKSPRTRVLLLTSRASEAHILDALSHGARGFLERKAVATFLAKAVVAVDAGEAWVPRRMVGKIVERLASLTIDGGRRGWAVRPGSVRPTSNRRRITSTG